MTKEIRKILKKDLKKYETLVNNTDGETQKIYMKVVMFFQELIDEQEVYIMKRDCFAFAEKNNHQGCRALKELYCKKEECRFYKRK